jgi:hypothetical protein
VAAKGEGVNALFRILIPANTDHNGACRRVGGTTM